MRLIFFSLATAALLASAHAQSPIVGDWQGAIDAGAAKIHIVLHITAAADGTLKTTFDSPDQGAKSIPVATTTFKDNTLSLDVAVAHATYSGKLHGDEIDGTWTQGADVELNFKRATAASLDALAPKRPQNPLPPFPYRSEDLTYTNTVQHDVLAATITIPPGKGPFPAVLLITGSGAQDRDETILGHKPFLVLADYLTRHGIVVLRADDRGTAKSTGNFATATTADFATDVEAGIALLKTRAEVDPKKVGLIGHSEGAVIAPMVAARNHDVAFIVMLAGSGVPGDQVITEQVRLNAIATGATPSYAAGAAAEEKALLKIVTSIHDATARDAALKAQLTANGMPDDKIPGAIQSVTSPWYLYFLSYDPAHALRQLKIPVLALAGSKDQQVSPDQNLPAIRAALAGDTHAEVDEFPGLNHLFQTAPTGALSEYATIEETIAPTVLEKIATWILQQ